jgi:hypothetical protein
MESSERLKECRKERIGTEETGKEKGQKDRVYMASVFSRVPWQFYNPMRQLKPCLDRFRG